MADRQILASIEITDHEVRLLVGEYYNTRIHVLHTATAAVEALDQMAIKNKKALTQAIKTLVDQASDKLEMKIERVLLAIPSYRSRIKNVRITQEIDNGDRRVSMEDIRNAVHKGYEAPMEQDQVMINWIPVKFYTNRIAFKDIPLNEPCDILDVDLDLFTADRLTAFDYVNAVTDAGIEILDITLDVFACAKEASLFEMSGRNPIILATIERDHTDLAVFYKGRLTSVKLLEDGYGIWEQDLMEATGIEPEVASKLIFQNADLTSRITDTAPVHMWKKEQKTMEITSRKLYETVRASALDWCAQLEYSAGAMLKAPEISLVLTGQGAELDGLDRLCSNRLGVPVTLYYPDAIGARRSKWVCCMGLIYSYIDIMSMYRTQKVSASVPDKRTRTRKNVSA